MFSQSYRNHSLKHPTNFQCNSATSLEHQDCAMPFDATNTNLVPFHISTCWYLTAFTCDDLHVFQSDPSCFQQPLDTFLSLIDVLRQVVVAEQCDMRFLIDLETKFLTHH